MGSLSSSVQGENSLSSNITPSDPDWIISHANTTELSAPEVERLWLRFQQLGYGPESSGRVSTTEHDIFADVFVRNIMKAMKYDSVEITFLSFLHVIKWFEISSTEDKLGGIYILLNNGRPLDLDTLKKTMLVIYPENNEAEINKMAQLVIQQIDKNNKGNVDNGEFMDWSHQIPTNQLDTTLSFKILPLQINQEARSQLSEFGKALNSASQRSANHGESQLTDQALRKVAKVIQYKDWQLVMNRLGLLQADIVKFLQSNTLDKVYAMLRDWRRREGALADAATLNTALIGTGTTALL